MTNTTRRDALHLLAAVPIAAAIPFTALAMTEPADPIFAAIDAHKVAVAATSAGCDRLNLLERELPRSRRKTHYYYGAPLEEVATDDPRWIAHCRAEQAEFVEEHAAERALITISPTTVAGVIALLSYAAERCTEDDGEWQWSTKGDDLDHDWTTLLHKHLAATLTAISMS